MITATPTMQNITSPPSVSDELQVLDLVLKLCHSLTAARIDYCHWKSNEALSRSASGDNDLDLLINRAHAQKFTEILFGLGFHEVKLEKSDELPGVLDYYGFDFQSDRLIHVHVHYQLVLGNDLSKNYHIPIEQPYLGSATQVGIFRVPAPEFELVIFILRMVLKHCTWDAILMQQGALSPSERREFEYLVTAENLEKAKTVLKKHLPYVDQAIFDLCVAVLQPGCPVVKRIRTGERLQFALEACARHPNTIDLTTKFSRWIWLMVRVGVFHRRSKRRLSNGGLMIAIVGGDGSGKTTAIDGLHSWLSQKFDVMRVHMGKPKWSWVTISVRSLLKIGTILGFYSFEEYSYDAEGKFPGYPFLIRTVCTARDRYLTYLKARRFASNGGLVICDRYSLSQFLSMDAARCAKFSSSTERSSGFFRLLMHIENTFYQKISLPDLLIVLKLNPETAVQRKMEESAISVRARSTLVWNMDWSTIPCHVLDASLPKSEVLAEVKSLVWENL